MENTFDAGTNGSAVTAGNSSASGDAFAAVTAGVTYQTAAATHGALGARTSAVAEQAYIRVAIPTGATAAVRAYLRLPVIPTGIDYGIITLGNSGGTHATLLINGDGKLRLRDKAGIVWTATPALLPNTVYRVEVAALAGSAVDNSTLRCDYYLGDDTTPVATGYTSTTANLGAAQTFDRALIGRQNAASAVVLDIDTLAWAAQSDYIGPPSVPLATPVVTLGAKTDATTQGGTDGTQTVTWPAIPGAASYEAHIALGTPAPTQGDFTLKAAGVTSPYTFTGLPAGQHAYGIKAKA